jgi:hypothetical protein
MMEEQAFQRLRKMFEQIQLRQGTPEAKCGMGDRVIINVQRKEANHEDRKSAERDHA